MRCLISILINLTFIIGYSVGNNASYQASDSLSKIIKLNNGDTSQVNAYYELSWSIRKSFPDSATRLAHQGIEIAHKISYTKGEANLFKCIGSINWNSGLYEAAIEAYHTALDLYKKLSNSSDKSLSINGELGISSCNNGLGLIAFHQGNYETAIESFQKTLVKSEELNNKNGVANAYNNIGLVHWKQDNYDRAIEYYTRALQIFEELDSKSGMSTCYNNIAIILKTKKNYDDALENYKKFLQIELEQNDKKGVATSYNNIGMLYVETNNYNLANEYFIKALKLREEINDKNGISSTLNNLANLNNILAKQSADINDQQQKYKQAIGYAQKSLKSAKENGALFRQLEAYEYLSQSYVGLNNFKSAFLNYNLSIEIKDSLFNKEKNEQIEYAEAKYQAAQKQQEIDKQKTELEKQKTYRNFLIILTVLIVLLIIVLYSRYVLKQRNNRILEEKNKELQKLSIVASETANAVTIYNANVEIEWINEGFSRLFGYTLEEIKEKFGNNLINISSNKDIQNIIQKVHSDKKSVNYESTIVAKSGNTFNLQTTLTPILNKQNQIIKFILIDSDITELKKAEFEIIQQNEEIITQKEEIEKHKNNLEIIVEKRTKDLQNAKEKAEESDRLKSSFLTNMSHEIRTPMNAIIGFSDMLNENSLDEYTKNEIIKEISTNSYSLLNLIDNILELARLDTNQFKIKKTKFNLSITLNEIYHSFYDILKIKGLEFRTNIPENNIEIISDNYRITQIYKNLIDNAIKFTEEGKIEIGFQVNRNSIECFVKDTGIGLDIELQDHIFERFTKIENDKKKLYRGAGLGLAICKNIVKLLHGDIWVESEPDQGATFYFTLPYHQGQVEQRGTFKPKTDLINVSNWSNKTILIAEDEESNFQYINMLLRKTDTNIIRAENGKEAIEICENSDVDLVLMDIKMPIVDGLEATTLIKKGKPDLPIISVSAYSSKEDIELSKKAGCEEHLSKPIQKTRLFEAIQKHMSN